MSFEQAEGFIHDREGDNTDIFSHEGSSIEEVELSDRETVEESNIKESLIIDSLPDESFWTRHDADDSTCCLATFTYNRENPLSTFVLIAVGSVDENLRLYCMKHSHSLTLLNVFSDFSDTVVSVKFSFDGEFLASASYDSSVHIYHINVTGSSVLAQYKHSLNGPTSDVEWLEWHPRGYALLAGSKDGTTWMWLAETSAVMNVFTGHNGTVFCGGFAHRGRLIVTGGADGSVITWDPKTSKRLARFTRCSTKTEGSQKMDTITCLASSTNLPLVAAGSENNTILLINVESFKLLHVFEAHQDTVESLCFVEDSSDIQNNDIPTLLISAGLDGSCYVWNCSRFQACFVFKHTDLVNIPSAPIVGGITRVLCLSDNNNNNKKQSNQLVVTAGTDCTLRLWELSSQKCLHVYSGHKAPLLDVAYIARFNCLISCSDDATIKLWQLP